MDRTEIEVRKQVAQELLAERQYERPRAQRVITMCVWKVIQHLPECEREGVFRRAGLGAPMAPDDLPDEPSPGLVALVTDVRSRQEAPLPERTPDNLTTDEVAEFFRTSPETVRYWRHVGKGPKSFKVGRRVLYARADVVAFKEAAS